MFRPSGTLHLYQSLVFETEEKGEERRPLQAQAEDHEISGSLFQFSSVAQSCPTLWIPWTAAWQASLSITNSWSLLKLTSIESVMSSNQLILCHPLLLPSIFQSFPVSGSFPMSQFFTSGGQSIGVSTSASVIPMNIQD